MPWVERGVGGRGGGEPQGIIYTYIIFFSQSENLSNSKVSDKIKKLAIAMMS